MRSRRRRLLPFVIVALFIVATALVAVPGRGDDGPAGTLALRRFLAGMGRAVREGSEPPARGTFVLLADLRDPAQARPILDWVGRGGRLVLADPGSQLMPLLGVDAGREGPTGRLAPGCVLPEVRGVRAVRADADTGLSAVDPAGVSCFGTRRGALLLVRDLEAGRIAVIAGVSALTNEHLGSEDNALLALGLIPEGDVVFGSPLPAGVAAPARGVWASLPLAAKAAMLELGLAVVLFAAARSRRLGRPVVEQPLVPIPAGELVRASARLYRNARAAGYVGTELRRAMIRRLLRRAGAPTPASPEEAAALLARAGAGREQELAGVLAGREPRTDDELIALADGIEEIRRRVEGADI